MAVISTRSPLHTHSSNTLCHSLSALPRQYLLEIPVSNTPYLIQHPVPDSFS